VLLQQPGGQILAQVDGARLALVEGDEPALLVVIEHAVEGGRGVLEPTLPESVARGSGVAVRGAHQGSLQVKGARGTGFQAS
jgi:hypothetical protein